MDKNELIPWHGLKVYPWNLPLPRPGVYILKHLDSNLCYVGSTINVKERVYQHSTYGGKIERVSDALRTYGKETFVACPLYYALAESATKKESGLWFAEQQLITAFDAFNVGLNKPAAAVNALCKTPEARAKRRASDASDETKSKRSEAMLKRNADPEFWARYVAALQKSGQNPERNKRIGAKRTGGIWITNGVDTSYLCPPFVIPEGWRRGQVRKAKKKSP